MELFHFFDFSRGERFALTLALCLALYTGLFNKKYPRSEDLVLRAEKGDKEALRELISRDLFSYGGVVLVAEKNRHYDYGYVRNSEGAVCHSRCLMVSFPSPAFLVAYQAELRRLRASERGIERVILKIDHLRESVPR